MFSKLHLSRLGVALASALLAAQPAGIVCGDEPVVQEPMVVPASTRQLVEEYCIDCHTGDDAEAGLDLETLLAVDVPSQVDRWERVWRKLQFRQMPPVGESRPEESSYERATAALAKTLDAVAAAHPRPGRTATFRRLTRAEYTNAIRDLLSLEIDAAKWLPKDESTQGFDNITVGELTPTLVDRYVQAAEEISRMALGHVEEGSITETIRVPGDVTQENHLPGLPIGTRGGTVFTFHFPQTAEYVFHLRLTRDRNEHVEGLNGRHELELFVDDRAVATFVIKPPPGGSQDHSQVDAHLKARVRVTAGSHRVGAAFIKTSSALIETMRQPYQARFNFHRHPRTAPALLEVSLDGPYRCEGYGDTPSRRAILGPLANAAHPSRNDALHAIKQFARRAWRRPVSDRDLARAAALFDEGARGGDFESGMELATAAILVSPRFLFRVEQDPKDAAVGDVYPVSDIELASRLSFFLWSSIPDDELLAAAERGALHEPAELRRQVSRMLADPKSQSLVSNFADQWLYLRNLDAARPDMRRFPDFDDNLRQAMRRETELALQNVMRNDLSVLKLLQADSTYVNERLARHYGIPHVIGDRFRKVALSESDHRGGILRHASILTVTSYATRTSPVLRGQWVLKNLLASPPAPPPANVPPLKENTVLSTLTVRERLAEHRANEACARCHNTIDPAGLALENFDAIGRWREFEDGRPVDATGGLPDGRVCVGVQELEDGLLERPELFVMTLTEKLLTFALGRGMGPSDAAAVRAIVRRARDDDYRFSTLMQAIVASEPFRMRTME